MQAQVSAVGEGAAELMSMRPPPSEPLARGGSRDSSISHDSILGYALGLAYSEHALGVRIQWACMSVASHRPPRLVEVENGGVHAVDGSQSGGASRVVGAAKEARGERRGGERRGGERRGGERRDVRGRRSEVERSGAARPQLTRSGRYPDAARSGQRWAGSARASGVPARCTCRMGAGIERAG